MEITKEYASKGVAGAGLGTGIAGLALGVLNSAGWLGNLAGGARTVSGAGLVESDLVAVLLAANLTRGGSCGAGCGAGSEFVTQREMALQQQLAAKDAELSLRESGERATKDSLEMYRYVDSQIRAITATLGEQAVQNQANKDSFALLQQQMACDKRELMEAISRESSERRCADNTIVNYVNATFYPKMVADVTTGDTTTAQFTYNPLPASTCGCKC